MRNHYKKYLFLFATLAALLMGMSGTGAVFAQGHARLTSSQKAVTQTCGGWSIVPSPNGSSSNNYLNGVAAVSANDVWAVGSSLNSSTDINQTLIEQWNGTNWSIVPSPNVDSEPSLLNNVAAFSASDVWAVGYYYNIKNNRERTLIEQWNGTSWSVVTSPDIGTNNNSLSGVAVISASDIWAVGSYYDNASAVTKNLTLHWNGTSWSVVSSPNAASTNNSLNGVAAISTSDVWAVGRYENSAGKSYGPSTLHWNGTKWSRVASPHAAKNNGLSGVAAVSTSDVWAAGYYTTSSNISQTLIEQWNGTSWSIVSSPNATVEDNLNGVVAISASDVWAVGSSVTSSSGAQTLVEQWNGTSWSIVSSPNAGSDNLQGVAADSTGDVWAVGSEGTSTLIEFYC